MSYPNRGDWGNSQYRGNCSGHVIKDLLEHYQPKKFVEVFSGGGTGQDVANTLNYKDSVHLDLMNGWNALVDEIPLHSDFIFSHPPYWDIINYSVQRKMNHDDDLSNNMSYEDFILKLDKVNQKIYQSLINGGRHAFLVGDVRRKGKYYSIIKDMSWFGDLESHIVKVQHNYKTKSKTYSSNSFIPIEHEHLLIFKKNSIWDVAIKYTKDFVIDLRNLVNVTWKDLVFSCMEYLGGKARLEQIYECLKGSNKAKNNQFWKEKIRQTLQVYQDFENIDKGIWKLCM